LHSNEANMWIEIISHHGDNNIESTDSSIFNQSEVQVKIKFLIECSDTCL
jgi:hypothetical protein